MAAARIAPGPGDWDPCDPAGGHRNPGLDPVAASTERIAADSDHTRTGDGSVNGPCSNANACRQVHAPADQDGGIDCDTATIRYADAPTTVYKNWYRYLAGDPESHAVMMSVVCRQSMGDDVT